MIRKIGSVVVLAGLVSLLSGTFACAEEGAGFVRMLQSNNIYVRIEAAKLIEGQYLVDPEVYPVAQERLRQSLREGNNSKEHLDEIGWLCKALASSGDSAYVAVLKEVLAASELEKIRQYARQSLEAIPEFAARNELLLKTPGDPTLSFDDNRLLRMMRSGDFALQRNAAKRVSRSATVPPVIYQAMAKALETHLQSDGLEKLRLDAMGWLCKALASSGEMKYLGVLRRVLDDAPTDKLRQHARDGLRLLGEV